MTEPIFKPSQEQKQSSNLFHFMQWLYLKYDLTFHDYRSLWQWSINDIDGFYKILLEYFDIQYDGQYQKVRSQDTMPGIQWFEGIELNYAEHIIRGKSKSDIALIAINEKGEENTFTWNELLIQVASLQTIFKENGLQPGDRVVAYLPNIVEASVSLLACIFSGYVWSSCSPDFGAQSVIDRFTQTNPKAFIFCDSYQYNGKTFDRKDAVDTMIQALTTTKLLIKTGNSPFDYNEYGHTKVLYSWTELIQNTQAELEINRLPFNHPMWILYSSGTTGLPKCITHSQGGMLIEHLKYTRFHNDIRPDQKFFWFTTTGWVMWNILHASWVSGAIPVLYDGQPMYPDATKLWSLADKYNFDHMGVGAPFIHACMKENIELPLLSNLKSLSSTGSPLNPEAYDWIYQKLKPVKPYLWSMSGGTDVATAFVGGCPLKDLYIGEIQCRALGVDLVVLNENGDQVENEVGELVIRQPMVCMPVYFWNDPGYLKYKEAYFDMFPGLWRHGDWIKITEHDGLIISGRSDTTLKRHGVRIGTAEIYSALQHVDAIIDSLIIHIDSKSDEPYMPLFVKLKDGALLDEQLKKTINNTIRSFCSPRHIPDEIYLVRDIPYTLSGKKMESPVKKMFIGIDKSSVASTGAMRNPEALDEFEKLAREFRK